MRALGMTLISCSRTAVACETRTSPGFRFDNDSGCFSFDTTSVWTDLAIRAVPLSTLGTDGCGHGDETDRWSTLARSAFATNSEDLAIGPPG